MFEQASRRLILALAEQPAVQQWVRRHGMRLGAARFVAGETVDAAIRRVRELNGDGFKATIDYLGESARSAEEARQALAVYLALTERMRAEAVDSTISVKPTQMGLALDPELAYANLLQLSEKATGYGIFMRLDMEASPFVE
ncbi:MAG TPA: proline dehydrogenase family protein, partial [Bacillota bacterium]